MTAFIVPNDDSGRVIAFDVIENELHESVVEITDHPVETGVNITDHIRPLPKRLSLTAYTSNTPVVVNPITERGEVRALRLDIPQWTPPIGFTPGALFRSAIAAIDGAIFGSPEFTATLLVFPDFFDAIVETHEVLLELQTNGVLLQIVTGLRTYDDMVIERVAAPRGAGDAGIAFGIDIRQIRVVESGQVTAPPVPADDVPGGKPLENKGAQGAKPPGAGEDAGKGGSIAFQILSGQGLI